MTYKYIKEIVPQESIYTLLHTMIVNTLNTVGKLDNILAHLGLEEQSSTSPDDCVSSQPCSGGSVLKILELTGGVLSAGAVELNNNSLATRSLSLHLFSPPASSCLPEAPGGGRLSRQCSASVLRCQCVWPLLYMTLCMCVCDCV